MLENLILNPEWDDAIKIYLNTNVKSNIKESLQKVFGEFQFGGATSIDKNSIKYFTFNTDILYSQYLKCYNNYDEKLETILSLINK